MIISMTLGLLIGFGCALAVDFRLCLSECDFDREFHFASRGVFRIARILCGSYPKMG